MKISELKTILADEAVTQGFFGQFIERLDQNNEWDDFSALCEIYAVKAADDVIEYLQAYNYFRNVDLTIPFDVKTLFDWRKSNKGFSEYCLPFSKVSEAVYMYFLEVLPPMYKTRGFMVSEPYNYDHDAQQSTYAAFCKYGGQCYFLGDIAPKKYDETIDQLIKIEG